MRIKRLAALSLAAVFTAGMLTGCDLLDWLAFLEGNGDSSSITSSPSSSSSVSRPSYDDEDDDDSDTDDTNSGDTETPENPDQAEETKPTLEKDGYEIDDEGNYTVNSEAGLLAWAESEDVLNADCALAADITFTSGTNWTPIGNDKETPYNGEFDGQGHTISGLNVTTGNQDTGMFGVLSSDAEVKNLHLENVIGNGNFRVGGIAGVNIGGTITGCMVTGMVSGINYVGGVVGYIESGTVEDCYWTAGTSGPSQGIGFDPMNEGSTTPVDSWDTYEKQLNALGFVIEGDIPVPNAIANKDTAANNLYINNPLTRFVLGL